MSWEKYIDRDPQTGVARLKGSEIYVVEILKLIAATGGSLNDVAAKFPELDCDQVRACQAWAKRFSIMTSKNTVSDGQRACSRWTPKECVTSLFSAPECTQHVARMKSLMQAHGIEGISAT